MQVKNKFKKRGAFTIVELLTVMSVIIILISLLVPALSQVQKISKKVVQKKQFNSIDVALEMYKVEHGEYPDSGADGSDGQPYCGAMKLAEAMIGQDQLGFHRNSLFRSDLKDSLGNDLYQIPGQPPLPNMEQNLKMREGPYLPVEYSNANRMGDNPSGGDYYGIYEQLGYKPFLWNHLVLCDVYKRRIQGASIKAGMPILYYKANPSGKVNPRRYDNGTDNGITKDDTTNIYNYKDNDQLVHLGAPWNADKNFLHPMDGDPAVADGNPNDGLGVTETFYYRINNNQVPIETGRPYKSDSYILLSAGYDGEYGTGDDIFNFD